jgi:hypothetical protein
LVTLMHRIVPPSHREAVLGDLWERCRTPSAFLGQGLAVLPFLVLTQVRRRSSLPVLGLQLFVLFACLRGFAPVEARPPMWARAALPTLFSLLALAWHDAYRAVPPASAVRRLAGEAAAVLVAIALYEGAVALLSAAGLLSAAWLLRPAELLFAACCLPVLSVLRSGSGLVAVPVPASGSFSDTTDGVAVEYADFRRAVRRRNRLEVVAMLATLLLAGLIVARSPGAFSPMVWLTLAGFFSLSVYLLVKGDAPAVPKRSRASDVSRAFRREIVRQHRLRSGLVWWWFAPLFIGLATRFVLRGDGAPAVAQTVAGVVLMTLLAACISALNRDRANLVQRRLARLARLEGGGGQH